MKFLVSSILGMMLILTIVACSITGHVGTDTHIPTPVGDVDIHGSIGVNEKHFDATNNSSKCFKITFTGANKQVTGTVTMGPGGASGTIPAGSTDWDAKDTPCPDGHLVHRDDDGAMHRITFRHPRPFIRYGAPLMYTEDSWNGNAVYSFVVTAHSDAEADQITDTVLSAPVGTAMDPRVTVLVYNRLEVGRDSATVYSIARQAFNSWSMDFNGTSNYASLATNAIQSEVQPGTWVLEAPIALSDIGGYDAWNAAQFHMQSGVDPQRDTSSAIIYSNTP